MTPLFATDRNAAKLLDIKPVTLEEAAAWIGPPITKRALYREHRAGRLRCFKLAGKLFTSEGDIQDWISSCRAKSSPPASISATDAPPAGSSETAPERSAQATAQSVAKMLQSYEPHSATISPAEWSRHHPLTALRE